MASGPESAGPFTELAGKYGPAVWDTLADNLPRDLRWNWLLLRCAAARPR